MPLGAPPQQYLPGSNAALLIDFDNVTMGIRSDLGKELRMLLNSDVIRGKVAVQRAYADWRRYPQYIVPLAENSVDLIFAPAYGSAKKNATDLRMAIDAIELVFTRPEIGTYILMTGDSDFSSCVLKLKEYGKYVIGVGMRESSSDLLIQNCDEYYSYHALSGLTRAGDVEESKEDPWVLVKRAVQQMVKNGDVMRTDRLKQVMLDIDPGFDEKKVGYSKFSRFVSEAASKDLLRLRKTENGQYEILATGGDAAETPAPRSTPAPSPRSSSRPPAAAAAPSSSVSTPATPPTAPPGAAETREKVVERIVAEAEAAAGNGRRRGRGRGGRDDRGRERPRDEARPVEADADLDAAAESTTEEPRSEQAAVPEAASAPAVESTDAAPAAPAARREPAARPAATSGDEAPLTIVGDIDGAYSLLQEAVRRLVGKDGKAARDGDVKRRMLELSRDFDEGKLGFPKFTRFLRQAHDAEVIDLARNAGGNYEVSLPASGRKLPPPRIDSAAAAPAGAAAGRDRGPTTADEAGGRAQAPSRPESRGGGREAPRETAAAERPEGREAVAAADSGAGVAEAARAVSATTPPAPATTAGLGALRGRRGGRMPLEGPPPILPGQGIPSLRAAATSAPAAAPAGGTSVDRPAAEAAGEDQASTGATASDVQTADSTEGSSRSRRSRRGGRGRSRGAAGTGVAVETASDTSQPAGADAGEAATAVSQAEQAGETGLDVSPAPEPSRRSRGGRGRGRGRGAAAVAGAGAAEAEGQAEVIATPAATEAEAGGALAPDVTQAAARKPSRSRTAQSPQSQPVDGAAEGQTRGKGRVKGPAKGTTVAADAGRKSVGDLGLPRDAADIRGYLAGYAGVGAKTADSLVDRFGAGVFDALQTDPDEVVRLLGERRARSVLDQWISDFDRRAGGQPAKAPAAAKSAAPATPAKKGKAPSSGAASGKSGAAAAKGRGTGARKGTRPKS